MLDRIDTGLRSPAHALRSVRMRRVAAHAHGAEGVRWASEAGVDSVEHGHLTDDAAIATLKKNGTYLVPTLFLTEYMEKNMERSDLPEFSKQKMRDVIAA